MDITTSLHTVFHKEQSPLRSRLWRHLVSPSPRLRGREERRRASLQMAIVSSLGLLALGLGVLRLLLAPGAPWTRLAEVGLAFGLFAGSWVLARGRFYRFSGCLCLLAALGLVGLRALEADLIWGLFVLLALLFLVPVCWGARGAVPITLVTAALAAPAYWSWPVGSPDLRLALIDLAFAIGTASVVGIQLHHFVVRIQSDLVMTRDRYRALLETVFEGILVVRHGRVASANPGFRELVGPREAELRGRAVGELLVDPDGNPLSPVAGGTVPARLAGSTGGMPMELELVCRRLDEKEESMLVAVRDVSARTRLIDAQLRIERLDSLSLIAGGIAHDFNNLLTAVLANLNLLQLFDHEPEQTAAGLAEVEKAALRAQDLAQQLLAFSREEGSKRQAQALGPLVESVAKLTLRGTRVLCSLHLDEVSAVEIDIGKIHQVLVNLFVNATEAMPGGGQLEVRLHEGLESLPVLPAGRYVCLEVRDDGPGIEPEILEKIFEPYFTTKETGNGLGLATSFAIARQHEGLLTVDSPPGGGATFRLYLPSSDQAAPSEAEATTIGRFHGTALVMDDDPGVRQVLSAQLRVLGLRVDEASNVEEAVRLYRDSLEQDWRYALVLLDLTIPGGRGGIEAFRQIRELDLEARAVILSGYVDHPAIGHPREYGFCTALRKPYTFAELSDCVRDCLVVARHEVAEWPAAWLHEPTSQFPVVRDESGVN